MIFYSTGLKVSVDASVISISFKLTLKKIVHWMSSFTVWTFLKCQLFILTRWSDLRDATFSCQWTKRHNTAAQHGGFGHWAFWTWPELPLLFVKRQKFDWINGDLKGLRSHQRTLWTSQTIMIECKICTAPNTGFGFQGSHTGLAF